MLDRDVLVAKRGEGETALRRPGQARRVGLWDGVGVEKDMPPSGPKPSDAERALIGSWIAAGAPFPLVDAAARPVKSERDVLAAIRDHLRGVARERPALPALLHAGQPAQQPERRRRRPAAGPGGGRQAGQQPELEARRSSSPRPIDREQTVFAIDLRDVGWDERDLLERRSSAATPTA